MHLIYLPEQNAFFSWTDDRASSAELLLSLSGTPAQTELLTHSGRKTLDGVLHPLLETFSKLVVLPNHDLTRVSASVASWGLASKLATDLVVHGRVVPVIAREGTRTEARWVAAIGGRAETEKIEAIAKFMPPAAYALPVANSGPRDVWAPETLLRSYLDAITDALVRAANQTAAPTVVAPPVNKFAPPVALPPWPQRWRAALSNTERNFVTDAFTERAVLESLERWSEPAQGSGDRLRACFRLELPTAENAAFTLRFVLQSPDDPSLFVTAADVWKFRGRKLEKFGRAFRDPQESLLTALGRAARLFAPIEAALVDAKPELLMLDASAAWEFLERGAKVLAEAGFGVIVPGELTAAGQRRLRLRMRVGGSDARVANIGKDPTKSRLGLSGFNPGGLGATGGATTLAMNELVNVDWQAVIGDSTLTDKDLAALAKQKAPLVRFKGAWVAIDPNELSEIRTHMSGGKKTISVRDAIKAALVGETREGTCAVSVSTSGNFADLLAQVRAGAATEADAPPNLNATLRPYQRRGLAWLKTMGSLGLGACLADDMGLGKTMQILAFLLARQADAPTDKRPTLLIAPTSVLGNWESEISRFSPSLGVVPHYGLERSRGSADLIKKVDDRGSAGLIVLSSYGLLRRDADLLSAIEWSTIILDEAQNIKNPLSATARATRTLRGHQRFALTGTPVENRLSELWSILDFANPSLLGGLDAFRREFALPIERYGDEDAAARLRKMVGPFVLRRLKSDPTIIQDLPDKNEMTVVCTLTREQATLYKAAVDEELRRIESSEGIARRGRVLALLLFLKQICNHPAQYLAEKGPLPGRSGKLARITEMLEEAVSTGDKALVFTQFREMGNKLAEHLASTLGVEVLYLHGGTLKKARDEMVSRFQDDRNGPKIFVLSLKAGGTGLNLTAANHVFHYDRWWNPAVEDQATDRAYRIGQTRNVQVHKLFCAGTVEEKLDRLLVQKRELAAKVVGSGENWITELDNGALRELFALSSDVSVSMSDDDDREPVKRERAVKTNMSPLDTPSEKSKNKRTAKSRPSSS